MGTTLRTLIDIAGGVSGSGKLQAVLLGGAAGSFVTPKELDMPLTFEGARAIGATLGSGVVMLFDDTIDLRQILLRIARFFRHETCGQCVPCRVGVVRQHEALERLIEAKPLGSVTGELKLLGDDIAGDARRFNLRPRSDRSQRAGLCHPAMEPFFVNDRLAGMNQTQNAPQPTIPVPRGPIPQAEPPATPRSIELKIDGNPVSVPEGSTILDATRKLGLDTPTLCFLESLTPVNACRICVVEMEGSRTLVPACSRKVEQGMAIKTDSERVRLSRKLVLEFLASSVDLSTAPTMQGYMDRYGAQPERFGVSSATVAQPIKVDNDLYVRDYSKCVLCYKCVEACGVDAQNTFAIAVAGRGFSAHIATEFDIPLPDSACVYCGNCIGVCPTGALMAKSEYDMRQAGVWDESRQTRTDTICPYCGVGCSLTVHQQDGQIVRVSSPIDHSVTHGNLCIKGRFGWQFVQIQPARGD